MLPNSNGKFTGSSDSKIDYKYYVGGDIFNDKLCDFVVKHCTPLLGMESIDNTFKTYGMTYCGICDGWHWFTKENITLYATSKGCKPIEEATNEECMEIDNYAFYIECPVCKRKITTYASTGRRGE